MDGPNPIWPNSIVEDNKANNVTNKVIQIQLTPPPDLQVTSIHAPAKSFSGQSIPIAPDATTTYTLVASNSAGREYRTSFTVVVSQPQILSLTGPDVITSNIGVTCQRPARRVVNRAAS